MNAAGIVVVMVDWGDGSPSPYLYECPEGMTATEGRKIIDGIVIPAARKELDRADSDHSDLDALSLVELIEQVSEAAGFTCPSWAYTEVEV